MLDQFLEVIDRKIEKDHNSDGAVKQHGSLTKIFQRISDTKKEGHIMQDQRSGQVLTEPERQIPVIADYDVIVVGGGIAGTAAALAASRNNAKVCIIEKENAQSNH